MIATTRSIGVELPWADLAVDQIFPGWCCLFERACGRDVVGSDHIAQDGHNLGILKIGDLMGFHGNSLEIWRILDIG